MIKKIFGIIVLCFLVSAIGFGLLSEDNMETTILDDIVIQKSEIIDLYFENANIELMSWDNNHGKIVGTDLFIKQKEDNKEFEMKVSSNIIRIENFTFDRLISSTLYTWLPIVQIEKNRGHYSKVNGSHFKIYLPKGVKVNVYAKKVKMNGEIKVINDTIISSH